MKKMTPRERVLAAARREPVDRIPVMLWIEPHTTLKLAAHVVKPKRIPDRLFFDGLDALQNIMPTEELRNAIPLLSYLGAVDYIIQLGNDMVEFPWFDPQLFFKKVRIQDGKLFITDIYGIERAMTGLYMEISKVPCATPEDVDRYRLPHLSNRVLHQSIRMFRRTHPDIAVAPTVPGVQDVSQCFMGMENLYTWMAMYPDVIKRFFNKFLEHTLETIRGQIKAGADIITILDDYGAQNRTLISKRMWEEFTFPCLKRQCEEVHRNGAVTMLHSCGHVQPLLDKFIEAGVDMLQSFQPGAGNDLEKAKREFGDKICFVTGIDSQTIPSMTPGEVRESILKNVRTGAQGGGFVLATNHAIQVDTPNENLKAIFDTLREVAKNGAYV